MTLVRHRIVAPIIRSDPAGDGRFGAPRGGKTHRGVDYCCEPGGMVYSPVSGFVSHLGYPYGDDPTWRYVEITTDAGYRYRIFYVRPLVRETDFVYADEVIGEAQDICERYPGQDMLAHIHLEIISPEGDYLNPETHV